MKHAIPTKGIIRYPFARMAIGDDFECPNNLGARGRTMAILAAAAYYRRTHAPGARFTTRKLGNTILCTRIA